MTKPKYPWDNWFSRKQLRLVRGRDYTCMPHSMAQQIRNKATVVDKSVSIRIENEVLIVTNWDWKNVN